MNKTKQITPPVIWFQDSLKPALEQSRLLRENIRKVSANLAEAHNKIIADNAAAHRLDEALNISREVK